MAARVNIREKEREKEPRERERERGRCYQHLRGRHFLFMYVYEGPHCIDNASRIERMLRELIDFPRMSMTLWDFFDLDADEEQFLKAIYQILRMQIFVWVLFEDNWILIYGIYKNKIFNGYCSGERSWIQNVINVILWIIIVEEYYQDCNI